jgi:hypothetical protein
MKKMQKIKKPPSGSFPILKIQFLKLFAYVQELFAENIFDYSVELIKSSND